MIIKRVEHTPVTNEELNLYKEKISELDTFMCTALDVGMDKRIVTLKFGGEYDDLTLVNPKVTETSDDMVMYIEKDSVKSKNRKTIRHKSFSVETDNLGLVQFSSDKTEWKSNDEFFNDMGLFESVVAQRLIDAIDGIDITDKIRAYSQQLKAEKTPGRNERVMVQSPDGEMEFMKYKKAEPLLEMGYQLV
jgi:peptide deformylase